jgi:hypothetical protein
MVELIEVYWWLILGIAAAILYSIRQYRQLQRTSRCPNCGGRVPPDHENCPVCNRPFEHPLRVSPRQQRLQKWALVVSLVLAGLYTYWMYFLDPDVVEVKKQRAELSRAAEMYVQRFILLEGAGRYDSLYTHLSGCDRAYRPELDTVELWARARVLGSELLRDTVLVRVEYLVLGYYYRGFFAADVHFDTVTIYVYPDTTGLARIDCDRIDIHRWGVEAMGRLVGGLDESSRRAWEMALQQAAQLQP